MPRKFDVGDIVYQIGKGINHLYEVNEIYPLIDGEERHFKLVDLSSADQFEFNQTTKRFYAIDYFKPICWIIKREVIFEKWKKEKEYLNR